MESTSVHPQYINDLNGKKSLVVLPVAEFESIMEELEEIEDIRAYDKAKEEDTGERITLSEYLKKWEANNA